MKDKKISFLTSTFIFCKCAPKVAWGENMSVSVATYDFKNWKVAQLKGRIDAFNDKRVSKVISDLAAQGFENFAVDLQHVEFVSFLMIREFLKLSEEMHNRGGEFVLLAPTAQVRRHLESFVGHKKLRIFRNLQELEMGLFLSPRSEFTISSEALR
jgi:anti-anti-sigma factor